MAIFKANDFIRLIFRSQIRQIISVNGFKRHCETSSNPFKNFQRELDDYDEESDGFGKSKSFGGRHEGSVRSYGDFQNRESGRSKYASDDRRYNAVERYSKPGGFDRRSGNYDDRPNSYEKRYGAFERRSDEFSRRYDGRSKGFERRNNPEASNYYRRVVADSGKLINGFGTESEWFAKRNVQLKKRTAFLGSQLIDQPVTIECGELTIKTWDKFSEIENLDPRLSEVLANMGHIEMAPIQKNTYDIINRRLMDILGSAETGSGKTLAFLIPILNNILSEYPKQVMEELKNGISQTPLMVVLAPTRELVQQIEEEAEHLLELTPLRVCDVIGGVSIHKQIQDINRGCHALIATPGRLIDLLERRIISLRYCTNLVIDEADRMLDMGFEPQIKSIVHESDLPKKDDRHTSMFSATFPVEVMGLARGLLQKNYGQIRVGSNAGSRDPTIPRSITQSFLLCSDFSMMDEVAKLLADSNSKTIIFCNKKMEIKYLQRFLENKQIRVSSLHGDLSQQQRDRELESFKNNESRILIATSIAARGLDVADVESVVNYGAPMNIEEYIHRVGRCGRMGRSGHATTLMNRDGVSSLGRDLVKALEKCGQPVPEILRQGKGGFQNAMSRRRY